MVTVNMAVAPSVLAKYPDLEVGALGVAFSSRADCAVAAGAVGRELAEARSRLDQYSEITDHPSISSWRAAYAKMGVKPSRFRSSIESLLRRAQKDQLPSTDIPLVDFYNVVSLVNAAPLGGYDAAKLIGRTIELRLCRPGTDTFYPLGADPAEFPMKEGVVVYASGDDVLCWGFNCRDSKLTCIDDSTTAAIFFSETADRKNGPRPGGVLKTLGAQARAAGGRCGSIALASSDNLSASIEVPD